MFKLGTEWPARTFLLAAVIAAVATGARAQGHGTVPGSFRASKYSERPDVVSQYPAGSYVGFFAESHYPLLYSGDTWTGTVTSINGREISLAWIDNTGKIESFTGQVVPSYDLPEMLSNNENWDTVATPVAPPSASLVGKRVMVYYFIRKEKVKLMGKKFNVEINFVFRFVQCDVPLSDCASS